MTLISNRNTTKYYVCFDSDKEMRSQILDDFRFLISLLEMKKKKLVAALLYPKASSTTNSQKGGKP